MKQLIIGQNKSYATGVDYKDITKVPEGTLGLFNLSDGSLITSNANFKGNFAVVCGRGENKMPLHFPEVDIKSLTISKAEYVEGETFTAAITIPTPEAGKHYTVIVAKCGTHFHERNRWTYTSLAKGTIAADVAKDIVKQLNANSHTSGVKATNTGGKITITAINEGDNYEVIGADELMGVEPTNVTPGVKTMLDKAYIQDLASRCAAGKGFNYLADDGVEIYPGYPEVVADEKYVIYTLRFAVPRVGAKQRDEVVYQLLHIALPTTSSAVSTLDSIFNLPTSIGNTSGSSWIEGWNCPALKEEDEDESNKEEE